MISSKLFILSECENVKASLDQSLRHDFGYSRSKAFFDEINGRLVSFRALYASTDESDVATLATASSIISDLSSCLSLIERSHLGEFSWAFADAIIDLASPICSDLDPTSGDQLESTFFISSNGGLKAYQIVCESSSLIEIGERRILNIVFPNSLKHHVLLHAILGHEICHAALVYSMELKGIKDLFFSSLKLASNDVTDWCKKIQTKANTVTEAHLSRWKEELICDLFGLILIGPSFLSALKTLLFGIFPSGLGDDKSQKSHPPPLMRVNILLQAVSILGWDKFTSKEADTKKAIETFWEQLINFPKDAKAPILPIIEDSDLKTVIEKLHSYLERFSGGTYSSLDKDVIDELYLDLNQGIPPNGSSISKDKEIIIKKIDFRLQIFAGWLKCSDHFGVISAPETGEDQIKFFKRIRDEFLFINKLCERGILQQQAIKFALDNEQKN